MSPRAPLFPPALALLGRAESLLQRTQDHLGDALRLTRFFRGRLEFEGRPDDIFVATYPRSGTTWMQAVLHQLTTAEERPFEHICEVAPWFERSLAVGYARAADLAALPSPRVFKSHLTYPWLPPQGRVVAVVREVHDVVLSYYHFYRSHLAYSGTLEAFFRRFLRGQVQYGSWYDHVASYRAQADNPRVLLLRFEDLKADLSGQLDVIAKFLNVPLDAERRQRVLRRCSFAYMKAHEEKFDFVGEFVRQHGYREGAFLRRGEVNEGRVQLSARQQEQLRRVGQRRPRPGRTLNLAQFLK